MLGLLIFYIQTIFLNNYIILIFKMILNDHSLVNVELFPLIKTPNKYDNYYIQTVWLEYQIFQ